MTTITATGQATSLQKTEISQLPEETLLHILHYLPASSATQTAPVSKQWHRLAVDDQYWKGVCLERGWQQEHEGQSWRERAMIQVLSFERGNIVQRLPTITCSPLKLITRSERYCAMNGNWMAIVGRFDGSLTIWDLEKKEVVHFFDCNKERNVVLRMGFCRSYLAVCYQTDPPEPNQLKFYHLDGRVIHQTTGHYYTGLPFYAAHPQWLADPSNTRIDIYSPFGQERLPHIIHAYFPHLLSVLNNDLIYESKSDFFIFDMKTGEQLTKLTPPAPCNYYTSDGQQLVTASFIQGSNKTTFRVYGLGFNHEFEKEGDLSSFALRGNILAIKMGTVDQSLHLVNIKDQKTYTFENPDSRIHPEYQHSHMSWDGDILYVFRADDVLETWDFSQKIAPDSDQTH